MKGAISWVIRHDPIGIRKPRRRKVKNVPLAGADWERVVMSVMFLSITLGRGRDPNGVFIWGVERVLD